MGYRQATGCVHISAMILCHPNTTNTTALVSPRGARGVLLPQQDPRRDGASHEAAARQVPPARRHQLQQLEAAPAAPKGPLQPLHPAPGLCDDRGPAPALHPRRDHAVPPALPGRRFTRARRLCAHTQPGLGTRVRGREACAVATAGDDNRVRVRQEGTAGAG